MNEHKPWIKLYPETVSYNLEIPNKTLPQILQEIAEKFPTHEAISFYQKKMTYDTLFKAVMQFAASLQQSGIKKSDRVALMLPNCPHYVLSYYGALSAGAIVTQINPMLAERELQYILADSGAEAIIVLDSLYSKVKEVQMQTSLKTIVTVSFTPSLKAFDPDYTWEEFLSIGARFQSVDIDPENDVAVLQYTGGTTGRSKGAMLTHRNIVANVVQCYEFFKESITFGCDSYLTVIPLFHVFGMTCCMNLAIYTAASLILLPRFDLEEVLLTIKNEHPNKFPGVPTMYVAITNHPKAEEYGIDSIEVCNSGSAPMPVELLHEFERKTGSKILEGYGLSEASPVTHCNPLFAPRKPGSIGIGYPLTDYKIVDLASGSMEVSYGEIGELIVKGPQIMKGYWNMPEETAHTLRDGWLYTGDIAKMDEYGYVYIVDRKKDLIIASGFNVYPRDIEEVLYEHPAVQEAVVVGVPDAYRGETVKAYVVVKEGKAVTEAELIAYCRDNMAHYKAPTMVEFRNELPKTNVGKILRRKLREEAQNNLKN